MIVSGGGPGGTVRVWDTGQPGEAPRELPGRPDYLVRSVAFSADGQLLLAGTGPPNGVPSAGEIHLWDTTDLAADPQVLSGFGNAVMAVAASPDGIFFAGGGKDGTIRIWRRADLTAPPRVLSPANWWVLALAFGPDNPTLAAGIADGSVRVWDLTNPPPAAPATSLGREGAVVSCLAVSPDGRFVAAQDRTARCAFGSGRNQSEPVVLLDRLGNFSSSCAVAFSGDGGFLASAGDEGTVWVWNVRDRSVPPREHGGGTSSTVYAVAFSGDGTKLIAGADHDTLSFKWDLARTGSAPVETDLHDPRAHGPESRVDTMDLTPDGRILASATNDQTTVRVWNLTDLRRRSHRVRSPPEQGHRRCGQRRWAARRRPTPKTG